MAGALARGWGDPVLCTDSGSGRARAARGGARRRGARLQPRAGRARRRRHPRPQAARSSSAVAEEIGDAGAGRRLAPRRHAAVADVQAAYPAATVFRVEPNVPVAVRKGVIAFAAVRRPARRRRVKALFARVGTVVEVPERLMTVAGAISGVGPAYWALIAEAWTDAAVRHGMPAAQAATLVTETMAGTAALLTQTDTLALRRGGHLPGRDDRARARGARAGRRARRAGRRDGRRGGGLMRGARADRGLPRRADPRLHADHLRLDHRVLDLLVRRARALLAPAQRGVRLPARRHEPVPARSSAGSASSSARSTSARSSRSWRCRSSAG